LKGTAMLLFASAVSAFAFVYLLVAIVRPEKF
jgi:K+-transporting ATPase KdpF subunit